jgi:glutamate-1-semialdehyde 2,1-aminomutase
MDMIAPLGPVYQAGTLSGNPLAMAAGLATICHLRDHREIYGRMERMAATLVAMVTEAALDAGLQVTANRVGSMFTWFFTPETVTDWLAAATCNTTSFGRFHHGMLEAGVYLPPSQFEAAFLGAAHTDEDIHLTVAAAREALTGVQV